TLQETHVGKRAHE
nr:hypothetical protein [Tanacetum cinerariifolium]